MNSRNSGSLRAILGFFFAVGSVPAQATDEMLAGYAPRGDGMLANRFTSRFLGDQQNDYWPDDPARPAEPQLTMGAQSFVLKKKSEIWTIEIFIFNTSQEKPQKGIDLRIETSEELAEGSAPSGKLAWSKGASSLPVSNDSSKYWLFSFDEPKPLPPGRYWIVMSKEAEDDPAQHRAYFIPGTPLETYPEGGYAEWEKETASRFDERWKPFGMNTYFQVLGRVVK